MTKRIFFIFTLLAFVAVFFLIPSHNSRACNKNGQEAVVPATELLDQPYGDYDKQKFDIYLPSDRNTEATPVFFVIHGGGWVSGNKSAFNPLIKRLQEALPQVAFVSIGYRLADPKTMTNLFPTQEEDVKACIEYIMNKSEEYGISKKFAILGGSAGAHLAMLYAYKHGRHSHQPVAVASMVGPTNISNIFEQVMMTDDPDKKVYLGWFIDAVGGTNEEKPELCYTSSPINYVTNDSPPTLLLYGGADNVVPSQQAEELADKLTVYGVEHIFKLYPGRGHNLKGVYDEAIQELIFFLNVYLK